MKYFKFLILSILLLITSGCFKTDNMESINVYTSIYPIQYGIERLYGNHSTINSIYPNDIDINKYNLNDKQITDYSKSDLFLFNGLSKEKDYAVKMLNKNEELKIIDVSLGIEQPQYIEEIWLNPYDYLMIVENIRKGLNEYITNPYLKEEVNKNYDELKVQISEIDAELKTSIEHSGYKSLLVSSDMFKFLEKYDYNIISLEENDNLNEKTINDVKKMIKNGIIKYIYVPNGEKPNNTIQNLLDNTALEIIYINKLSTISDEEVNNKEDYITITNKNIESFKKELYK